MSEEIIRLFTDGLLDGYVGSKNPDEIQRAGFTGKANNYLTPDKGYYHDEWFAEENGGGQELVETPEERYTRLYAGGVITINELQKLGLTTGDVIDRLITSVRKLKEKTRLTKECSLDLSGGWVYSYEILMTSKEVPLTIGYESIRFNGREVFAHGYMISPIK